MNKIDIKFVSYSYYQLWETNNCLIKLIENILNEKYNFIPLYFSTNNTKLKPIKKPLKLSEKLMKRSVEDITLCSDNDTKKTIVDISFNRNKLKGICYLSYRSSIELNSDINKFLSLLKKMIENSKGLYAYCHERIDIRQINYQRENTYLLPSFLAKGAYWITYYSKECVESLGGVDLMMKSPAWNKMEFSDGILLISHPDPLFTENKTKKEELEKLNEYLEKLA